MLHEILNLKPQFLRPHIRQEYPLNLSILLSGGKESKSDFPSNGEWTGISLALRLNRMFGSNVRRRFDKLLSGAALQTAMFSDIIGSKLRLATPSLACKFHWLGLIANDHALGATWVCGWARVGESPIPCRHWCYESWMGATPNLLESSCLRVQLKERGKLLVRLCNTATTPIANKYREGKLK